jgi:hypothetical protein
LVRWLIVATGVLDACISGGSAIAGTVTAFQTVTGPGLGTVTAKKIVTTQPNNDDVVGMPSPNTISMVKRFDQTAVIDLVFKVNNSGGTTEYFVDESGTNAIWNNMPDTWKGFQFALGFGTGARFIPSSEFDFLDFDQPYPPSPTPASFVTFKTLGLPEDRDVARARAGSLRDADAPQPTVPRLD